MKRNRELSKQLSLIPGYLLLGTWCLFTFLVIGWIILASFSTTPNIFQNNLFKDGLHPENYTKALITHNVARYFINIYNNFMHWNNCGIRSSSLYFSKISI